MPKIIDEEAVFAAVLGVLISRGYENATTQALAAAAQIHEATLFRKYESKARLIERAVAQQLATTPLSRVRYSGDLRADLLAIVAAYAATSAQHGEILPILLLEAPRHPELRDAFQAPLANIQKLVDILARYQHEGLLREEPPLTSISALLGPLMVSAMFRRAAVDLPPPAIDVDEHVRAFLHGRLPG